MQYTLYSIHYTVYTIHYIVYTIYSTLYSHCALQSKTSDCEHQETISKEHQVSTQGDL